MGKQILKVKKPKVVYQDDLVTLVEGDCRKEIPRLGMKFTACVTDPPYELDFMGKGWDSAGVSFEPKTWSNVLHALLPGAMLLSFGGTRTFHRIACAIEDGGFEIVDCISWLFATGFPKSLDISKAIDKAAGASREKITATHQIGWQRNIGNVRPYMSEAVHKADGPIPTTEAAKLWDGWGTALKPAWEPIIVAMRPFAGTFVENAERNGVAGINIDAARVGAEKRRVGKSSRTSLQRKSRVEQGYRNDDGIGPGSPAKEVLGRWPANVVLDEAAARQLDKQTGPQKSGGTPRRRFADETRNTYGKFSGEENPNGIGSSSGDVSRFYYCAKASQKERGELNSHPTVKPLALMEYLLKLVTMPKNTLILDPFAGSGTTLFVAKRLGIRAVGIEESPEYCEIAIRRLRGSAKKKIPKRRKK